MLYLGRYGYGATWLFRRASRQQGSQAAADALREQGRINDLENAIVTNLIYEGKVFATYDSLIRYLIDEDFVGDRLMTPLEPDKR